MMWLNHARGAGAALSALVHGSGRRRDSRAVLVIDDPLDAATVDTVARALKGTAPAPQLHLAPHNGRWVVAVGVDPDCVEQARTALRRAGLHPVG